MRSEEREFPKEWETASIQPICKEKGNQRGISLLPAFGEMY